VPATNRFRERSGIFEPPPVARHRVQFQNRDPHPHAAISPHVEAGALRSPDSKGDPLSISPRPSLPEPMATFSVTASLGQVVADTHPFEATAFTNMATKTRDNNRPCATLRVTDSPLP
jgi:hypothetical protein